MEDTNLPSAADLDAVAAEKAAQLATLEAEIEAATKAQAQPSAEDIEKQKAIDSLDAQIAEKRRTLAELHAASGTKAHYPDTHIERGAPVPEESHEVPERVHIDRRGVVFDPEQHHAEADGSPYRDSGGSFVKKEDGYKPPMGVQNFVKPQ